MPIDAQSPEFARLATRWLEGSATLADAAKLWDAVKTDPACAREFANQARFELLLQDTLKERQREFKIVTDARQQTKRHYRRVVTRRVLAAAAMVLAVGLVVRWVMPPSSREPVTKLAVAEPQPKPAPKPPSPTITQPNTGLTTLLVQGSKEHGEAVAKEPLKKRLDDFFLIGVHLDKVPLRDALKQLEDQLRELNYANSAELAALRVKLMTGAGNQLITFHSGGISFLKAARALASLAGFDMDVSDTGVSLIAKADGLPEVESLRNLQQLAQSMGATTDPSRSRLAELINDARSLGLRFDISKEGNITNLYATQGELQALSLLAQSRDQIRALPPLQFYVRATKGGGPDRVVTGAEADRIRSDYLRTAGPNPPVITVPMTETSPTIASTLPGEFIVGATPVGENHRQVTFTPQTDSLIPPSTNPPPVNPSGYAGINTNASTGNSSGNSPDLTPPPPSTNPGSYPSSGPIIAVVPHVKQPPTIAVIKPTDIIQFGAPSTQTLTITTSGGLDLSNAIGANGFTGNVAVEPNGVATGGTTTIVQNTIGSVTSLTKGGSGVLQLSGANNSYTGATLAIGGAVTSVGTLNSVAVTTNMGANVDINVANIDWSRWNAQSYNITVNESNASQMAFASAIQAQLGDKVHITIIPKTP